MSLSKTTVEPFYLLWAIPVSIIALAGAAGNQHLMGAGIGLAGALSLSGSI